ncbi:pyruvate, water dikinase regulatory protein [Aeoliella sp.]|uniref:pyruvate, water dikinase regulatory protein n=1 Tax=Aeoliella sp. TaxID=2795800 RepID=UPI003CCB87A4
MDKKKIKKSIGSQSSKQPYTLHLIAGATGDLLHRLASVAVTQFSDVDMHIVAHPLVDDLDKLQETLDHLEGEHPIVIHALPSSAAKRLVRHQCVARRIPHYDATGPLLDFLADCVGSLPDNDLSRLHKVDAAYQNRIEAMEFALAHDDSLGLPTLREADIVIVGVSRVSKSPTTLYLSSRGFKVANVSISPQTGFPEELSKINKRKIVAFTTQPKRLQVIRAERLQHNGVASSDYDNLQQVIREVMESEAEYRKRGYPVIDVTNRTIEQVAAEIMDKLSLSPR